MSRNKIEVGHVIATHIYPVKGMQGTEVDDIECSSVSVAGDRRFGYYLPDEKGAFRWLTSERFPQIAQYKAEFVDPSKPKTSDIVVTSPTNTMYDPEDPHLIEELSELARGRRVIPFTMGRGTYHSMPVSLLSLNSVAQLEGLLPPTSDLDYQRFRPNVLIGVMDLFKNFPEMDWSQQLVSFGKREDSAQLEVLKLDKRCNTVNIDPQTGDINPNVLKAIAKELDNKFGVYCNVSREGTIRVGDPVMLNPLVSPRLIDVIVSSFRNLFHASR